MKKKSLLVLCALTMFLCSCSNKANPESEVLLSETQIHQTTAETTSSIISSTSTTTTPITDSPTQTTTVSTTVATVVSNKEKVQLYRN